MYYVTISLFSDGRAVVEIRVLYCFLEGFGIKNPGNYKVKTKCS